MAIQSPLWQSLWPSFRGVYRLESTPRAFSCEPTGIPNFKIQGLECGHAKISAWPSMSVKNTLGKRVDSLIPSGMRLIERCKVVLSRVGDDGKYLLDVLDVHGG